MSKQTAIEWLHEIAKQREPDKFDWQQAKEMEKQQITSAYNQSTYQFANDAEVVARKTALEYYNETFQNK